MAHLPADIVADILSRLPVEPTLRFRCVSKPRCSLIDSPHFTKLHLKRSIENQNNRNLVLAIPAASSERRRIVTDSLYSVSMMDSSSSSPLDHPCSSSPEVWCSCDGLILINDGILTYDFSIWNPSTKKHRKLPPPTRGDDTLTWPDYFPENFYGFGYDSVHDDYKVLNIARFIGLNNTFIQVQVYSLNTNSWTNIVTGLPSHRSLLGGCGILSSGALHWATSEFDDNDDSMYRFIVAFDLSTMEYRTMPMPSINDGEESVQLLSLEGCLCVSCIYEDARCDVWVMKDYGVKESWTKLFSVDPPPGGNDPFNSVTPVSLSKDGTKVLLLQYSTRLVWYDIKHKLFQQVHIRGLQDIFHAELYVQSLVPLPPNTTVKSSDGKKQHIEENNDKNADKTGRNRDCFLAEKSSCCSSQVEEN